MKNAILIYLVLLVMATTLWVPASVSAQTNWITFRNPQFKFHFIHPPDWQVGTPRSPDVRGKVLSPKGKPHANCVIVVTPIAELAKYTKKELNKDIDSHVWTTDEWLAQLGDKFPGPTIAERKRIRIDNQPAQFAVFVMTYEAMEQKVYMKTMNFVTVSPGYLWHFNCGAAGRSKIEAKKNYEYWKPVFLRVFTSFVFER